MDIKTSSQIKSPRISERSSNEELLAAHKTASPQYRKLIEVWLRDAGYDWDEPIYHSAAMARALNAEQNQI